MVSISYVKNLFHFLYPFHKISIKTKGLYMTKSNIERGLPKRVPINLKVTIQIFI